jgi:hypothetical protein
VRRGGLQTIRRDKWGGSASKAPRFSFSILLLDFFRFLLIELSKLIASRTMNAEQLVKLTLYGLRISVFGPLDC